MGRMDEWTRLMSSKLQRLNDVLGCCDRSLCPADHPEDEVRRKSTIVGDTDAFFFRIYIFTTPDVALFLFCAR